VNARFFEPMLCLAVAKMPEGPEWQLELKLDGDRGIGIKSNSRAHLASRDGRNFSERFPTITRALNRLPDETVVDGEIAAVNENGVPSFNLLQNGGAGHTILFYAFDLLVLAGTDLRSRPLEQRRALLRELNYEARGSDSSFRDLRRSGRGTSRHGSTARPRRHRREAAQQYLSSRRPLG
jgi:ATP-dependent DNA ligase